MKFRKKPVVVEAFQFSGEEVQDCPAWFAAAVQRGAVGYEREPARMGYRVRINTLEGRLVADKHDWIIKGTKGEIYPCKPDIFAEIYEPAEQAERADGAMPMGGDRLSYTPPAAPNPNFVTTNPGAAAIHPSPDEFTEAELAADPILRFFHYKHLPPVLRDISAPFCQQARGMIDKLPRNAERTVALRKLLEAKDCAVRASLPTP